MTTPDPLERECVAFTRYLTGLRPTERVIGAYREAHARSAALSGTPPGAFDRLLLRAARSGGIGSRLVDAYAAVFHRRALVRRKWVVLLAILEACAPSADLFDTPETAGRLALVARLAANCLVSVAALAVAAVAFGPFHLGLGTAPAASRMACPE